MLLGFAGVGFMAYLGRGYVSLIDAPPRRGAHVSVISSIRTKPVTIASELRRQADTFLDLNDLRSQIDAQVRPNRSTLSPSLGEVRDIHNLGLD